MLYINYILLNLKAAFQNTYGNLQLIYGETDLQVKSLLLFATNKNKVEGKFTFRMFFLNYKIYPLALSQVAVTSQLHFMYKCFNKTLEKIYARKRNVFVYKAKK